MNVRFPEGFPLFSEQSSVVVRPPPQWSPVGRSIVFDGAKHGTAVADPDGGPVTSAFPVPSAATWSPTGTEIVYARGNTFYFAPVRGTGPTHALSLPISVNLMNAIAWTR